MALNCKPGDLAVIIRSDHPETRANIGAVVEVVRRWSPFDVLIHGCVSWVVATKGRKLMGFGDDGSVEPCDEIGVFDRHLRPLRPDGTPESVEHSEPAICT